MTTIYLIHPHLGVCATAVLSCNTLKNNVIKKWKHLYGKKFYECTVTEDSPSKKKILDLQTGEVYDSAKEASEITGISQTTIRCHANYSYKMTKGNRFKYED